MHYLQQQMQAAVLEARANQMRNPTFELLEDGSIAEWVGDSVSKGEVVPMTAMESAADELRRALMKYAGVKTLFDRFGGQEPPVGSVIQWTKSFPPGAGTITVEGGSISFGASTNTSQTLNIQAGREYVYVAFRAPTGEWFTTAQHGASKYAWEHLVKEIGDNPARLVSEWTAVPAPEKVEESALDPESWAREMFGKKSDKTAKSED